MDASIRTLRLPHTVPTRIYGVFDSYAGVSGYADDAKRRWFCSDTVCLASNALSLCCVCCFLSGVHHLLTHRQTQHPVQAVHQAATASGAGDQGRLPSQPPIKPAGFKDDHGALVAVYTDDALNRYMSNPKQSSSQSSTPPNAPQQQVPGLPPSTPIWGPYAHSQAMPMYQYPYPPQIPFGQSASQQSLTAPGPYIPHAWAATTLPGTYSQLPGPPYHYGLSQHVAQQGHPAFHGLSGGLSSSASFRGSGYVLPAPLSQPEFGLNRNFAPSGPKRFNKQGPGNGAGSAYTPNAHAHHSNFQPGQAQGFRAGPHGNGLRNDGHGFNPGAGGSPPRLGRRGSGAADSLGIDCSGHGTTHSNSHQHGSQTHSLRTSGSLPTTIV